MCHTYKRFFRYLLIVLLRNEWKRSCLRFYNFLRFASTYNLRCRQPNYGKQKDNRYEPCCVPKQDNRLQTGARHTGGVHGHNMIEIRMKKRTSLWQAANCKSIKYLRNTKMHHPRNIFEFLRKNTWLFFTGKTEWKTYLKNDYSLSAHVICYLLYRNKLMIPTSFIYL